VIRHPEAAAQRPSKDAALKSAVADLSNENAEIGMPISDALGPSPFEARFARTSG